MTRLKDSAVPWQAKDYGKLALSFFPAAVITWGIHEFAHWLTGTLLGYDMWMTFNQAGPVEGGFGKESHQILVGMAGPVVTWVQAIVALLLVRRSQQLWTYSLLFLACWMRIVALILSYVSKPNDEAAIGLLLGLPMWVLPAVSVSLLLALTYQGGKILRVGWKGNGLAYVLASIVTAIVVYSDQLLFFAK